MADYPDWYIAELEKLESVQQPQPNTPAPTEYPPEYIAELEKLEAQQKPQLGTLQPNAPIHPLNQRPIIQNPDNTISTVLTITVTDPRINNNQPTNIPSIYDGKEYDEEGAIEQALKSGQQWKSYKTVDEAVNAAKKESYELGKYYEENMQPLPPEYIAEVERIEKDHQKKNKGFFEIVGRASKERGVVQQKNRLRIISDLVQGKEPEPYELPPMPERGMNKEYVGTLLGQTIEADVIPGAVLMASGASFGGTLGSVAGPIGTAVGAGAGTMAANTAYGYLTTFADEYNNARLKGLPHKEAFAYAEKQGGIAGGFAAATGVLSRFGGDKILPYLAKQIPAQVVASEAENVAHNIVAKESGVDPERKLLEGWQEAAVFPAATTLSGAVLNKQIGKEHIRPPEKDVTPAPARQLPGPEGGARQPPTNPLDISPTENGFRAQQPMLLPAPASDGTLQPTPRVRPNPETNQLEPIHNSEVKGTPIDKANLAKDGATEQQMSANQVPTNIVELGNVIRSGAGLPPTSPAGGTNGRRLPPIQPPRTPPAPPSPGGSSGAGAPATIDLGELHQRITGIRPEPLNDFEKMVRNTRDAAIQVYENLQRSGTMLFDRFRPALNMGIALGAQRESQAVGYRSARFADHTHGAVNAAYTNGTPYWDHNQQIMRINTDAPSLLGIIGPHFESQFAAEYELYMYAKRVKQQGLHQDFPGDLSHLLHLTRLQPQLNAQLRASIQAMGIGVGTGGREQNLTIFEVNQIIDHLEATHPEFVQSWEQWNEYNSAINDFTEDTGLRDPDERDLYDHGDWISFERNLAIFDEQNYRGLGGKRLTRQDVARHVLTGKGKMYQVLDRNNQEFARLFERPAAVQLARNIGGKIQEVGIPVRNLYENMLAGTAMKLTKGIKNAAANQIMREAELLGLATQIPEHAALNRYRNEPIPNVVRTVQRGRPAYFYVDDPDIFNMMQPILSVPTMPGPTQQLLYYSKQLISWSTMSVPRVAMGVIIKDMMMMGMSGKDIFPTMGDAMAAYTQNLPAAFRHQFGTHDQRLIDIAAMGADVSFTRNRPVDITDRLYLEHYRPGEIDAMIVRGTREATRLVGRIGRAYETAHRLMRFDAAEANGLNLAEAGFEYMDYLDYQLKGSSNWVNEFIRISPFLQSYSQSLYKLGRDLAHATPPPGGLPPPPPQGGSAGAGRGPYRRPSGFRRMSRAAFNKTMSVCKWYAAFSIINALINVGYDEEDEQGGQGDLFKHNSQKRDNYTILDLKKWFGKGAADALGVRYIYIPKPWQLGQLFGTMPEQMVYWAVGKEEFSDQVKYLGRMVKNNFGIDIASNPVLKTLYESQSGKDWYTGRDIVPQGKQGLEPFLQTRQNTGEVAQKLGEQINVSPAKIEKAAENLLGGFMMGPLMVADKYLRDYEEPTKEWHEKDFLKNYFGDETIVNSDYVNQAWELYKDAEIAYNTINTLDKQQMDEKLLNYETKYDVQLRESSYKHLKKTVDYLKEIDNDMQDVRKNKYLTPDEKRTMIRNLQRAKNIEAYQAVKGVKAERKMAKK